MVPRGISEKDTLSFDWWRKDTQEIWQVNWIACLVLNSDDHHCSIREEYGSTRSINFCLQKQVYVFEDVTYMWKGNDFSLVFRQSGYLIEMLLKLSFMTSIDDELFLMQSFAASLL